MGPGALAVRKPDGRRAAATVVLLLLPVLGACTGEGPGDGGEEPAPAFEAPSLKGETVSLEEMEGNVVLLNIWATWCPPCRDEMPDLQQIHEEHYDDGLRVVGVSIDGGGSDESVRRFLDDLGIDFLILRDPRDRVSQDFAVRGVPASFLIDREGMIRWRHMGPLTADDPDLREALDDLLATE